MVLALTGCATVKHTKEVTVTDALASTRPQVRSAIAAQKSVILAWDASPDSSVVGYKIYQGGSSGQYTNFIVISNLTASISGLTTNETYYFAATGFNAAGLESLLSNEVVYTVPFWIQEIVISVFGQYADTPDGPFTSYTTPVFVGTNVNGMQYFRTVTTKTTNLK